MDLQEAWKKLDHENLTKPVKGVVEIRTASKHPVQKLISSFRLTLGLVVLFEAGFLYLFISMPQLVVKIFMALMVIVYVFFFIVNYNVLRKIERHFTLDANLKDSLQQIHKSTKASLAFQRRASLYIYPFATAAGFLLGLSVEKDVVEMMQKEFVIISLIICMILFTPASYYLALWLEKIWYEKYLNRLELLIEELSQSE